MTLAGGVRLGPYEIVEPLGAGGMGEVYRARDPRLGRDVAVKVLPEEVAQDPQRLAFFGREARAVAALNHPNILTVHDVGTHDGVPYVVTELLEGENFRELVSRRTPTVQQILGWGLQAARGLEAAHAKEIVHRDLKPENLFLTTDGRAKILDFGLAKLVRRENVATDAPTPSRSTTPGQVVGTVAYMSPEQARAHPVDARSDVFSFGVVLHELLARRHPFRRDTTAATLTAIVEETPPDLESLDRGIPPAVGGIVRRCLGKPREDRYESGHDLAVALETVLAAPSGAAALAEVEERSPYPGLSSFTEKDAEVFFGRDAEVAAVWRRLQSWRLLAVIGPSGVGKTSFVRAGVVTGRPDGWAALVCTPGTQPMLGLGRALAPELAGDREALQDLPGFEDPAVAFDLILRWRKAHGEVLLVVDQFEELFTLNAPDAQERFAGLLSRLTREADVHVLLSLRDDFLIRCHEQPALAPVFEHLTPLLGLTEEGLRQALIEPAKTRGYRFDDDALVGEMVSLVKEARGALPLLAFAAARLWEKRDREKKLLTREAYREIAGVEGALAQHAEATMDRIGPERQGLVREIFRHLITAQGTRAVVDREELLSAFPEREEAAEVLRQLIDARLLTSYEVEGKAGEPSHHRIEVVHESLLIAWPRLVRWQTQDEDSAQLRDQLKQAAHLWEEKNRTPDLLWSGTAFREYELWRERYPGQLTALEEEFSRSMTERALRRRRIRRGAVAAVIVILAGVAAAIAVSRHQTAVARDEARAEAQRAEASKLLVLAQARLDEDATEALAYATASLEVADTPQARLMAVRALQAAPPAWEVEAPMVKTPYFSPGGQWLAVAGHSTEVSVWEEAGGPPVRLPGHEPNPRGGAKARWASDDLLVTGNASAARQVRVWSLPEGQHLRTIPFPGPTWFQTGQQRLLVETTEHSASNRKTLRLRSWLLPDGEAQELGRVTKVVPAPSWFAPDGTAWLHRNGREIRMRPLPVGRGPDRVVSRHDSVVSLAGWLGTNETVLREESGLLHVCCASSGSQLTLVETIPKPENAPADTLPDRSGRWVRNNPAKDLKVRLWDLKALPAARPLELRRQGSWYLAMSDVHPSGRWLVATTGDLSRLTFWPLPTAWPTVVEGYTAIIRSLTFGPDSRWLVTSWLTRDDRLRLWPVTGDAPSGPRFLELPEGGLWTDLKVAPGRQYVLAVGSNDRAYVVPLDGSPARRMEVFSEDTLIFAGAISPSGRRVATAFGYGTGEKTLRAWDLDRDTLTRFDLPESPSTGPDGKAPEKRSGYEGGVLDAAFLDESTLYTGGDGGIRRWDLEGGTQELVFATRPGYSLFARFDAQARTALVGQFPLSGDTDECRPVEVVDLPSGASRALPSFGDCPYFKAVALDSSGLVAATGDSRDGLVRVGRVNGGQPHVLAGHEGTVQAVAISPDLRWVASAGEDSTLRIWPMPDLDRPPLHTLPREELLLKLKSLTNFRAVRDPDSPDGWRIELDPFPGWKSIPTW